MTALKTRLSQQESADWTHLSHLLHLAHHRNRNQHHRAHWYRHFSLLRKHVSRLAMLYDELNAVPDTYAARHRKIAQDKATVTEVEAELKYLADILVPRCSLAFSQLVADLRFAALGVVLVAIVSQICGIAGITAHLEDLAEAEVGEVLRRFEREEWGDVRARGEGEVSDGRETDFGIADATAGEDVGEVVLRDEMALSEELTPADSKDEHPQPANVQSAESTIVADMAEAVSKPAPLKNDQAFRKSEKRKVKPPDPGKKRKKAKKGGDAIDDLFADL